MRDKSYELRQSFQLVSPWSPHKPAKQEMPAISWMGKLGHSTIWLEALGTSAIQHSEANTRVADVITSFVVYQGEEIEERAIIKQFK